MVTGDVWFSHPLSATPRADIARQHRRGSINYVLIEKRNLQHRNVTPSAYPVSAQERRALKILPALTERA